MCLAQGIIGDDVHKQIFLPVVEELMRLVRFEEERIAGNDGCRTVFVAHGSAAGDDVIKFPPRCANGRDMAPYPAALAKSPRRTDDAA